MALNPVVFTEKVVRSFLRYQLTAYPFADERLLAQMRRLLSLDETRQSPLLKGPYVSLSRPFRQGAAVDAPRREGVFHPHMRQRIPAEITHVYGHQEDAIRAIRAGRTTLVSTGTGSGKTECFLYPIVSKCLELQGRGGARRDQRRHRLPDERARRGPARAPALAAGGNGHLLWHVRGQDPRAARARSPASACRRALLGPTTRRGWPGPPREAQRDRLPARGGLLARGDAHARAGSRASCSRTSSSSSCFLPASATWSSSRTRGSTSSSSTRPTPSPGRRGPRRRASSAGCARSAAVTPRTPSASPPRPRSWTEDDPGAAREFASRFFGVPQETVATVGEAYEREVWARGPSRAAAPCRRIPRALLERLRAGGRRRSRRWRGRARRLPRARRRRPARRRRMARGAARRRCRATRSSSS